MQKAEHVTPAKPCGPPVVTTVTVDANFESASREEFAVAGILVLSRQRPFRARDVGHVTDAHQVFLRKDHSCLVFAEATFTCQVWCRSFGKRMHGHRAVLIFKSIW